MRRSEGFHGIIGCSPPMMRLFTMLEQVAQDDASTVLIQGESGTGKELVARAIHALSQRGHRNLVPVNCAAIPDELLESELFGYVKGAFTGANQSKIGRIQYAEGGTLFLDEIGDMKPALQAKLLRVLQEREFEPVGGVKPVAVDLRVIAATHRDLEQAVEKGTFREDLYYRLNVVPVTIPPLRERREDIPLLAEKFIQAFNRGKKTPFLGFEGDAMDALSAYPWPGNIRELENLIQRLSIFNSGKQVNWSELPAKYQVPPAGTALEFPPPRLAETSWPENGIDFHHLVGEFEDRLIAQALAATSGNKKEAARLLNLKRTTLLEKIKKRGMKEL
ncbi:MAG: sigma-54-dependent Fis family transcriptional regulator [Desulfuromonadales bacterium]|nr:sigma-54-dependent Fis family transcriptional regulator [Desulfuromonadales bacterium]